MKLLFDANLSPRLAVALTDLFPGSLHVFDLQLGPNDIRIWDHAGAHAFTIISKDSDFSKMSALWGAPPKVVWLRVANDGSDKIARLIRSNVVKFQAFDADDRASLLIVNSSALPKP